MRALSSSSYSSFSPARIAISVVVVTIALLASNKTPAQAPAQAPAHPTPAPAANAAAGKQAFLDVARVLQSPRCRNCHPIGDAPLQSDVGRPHAMNITRASVDAGLLCSACHQEKNSEAIGIKGGPPGAPRWNLPPKETPMVFAGKTPGELCAQFKDPAKTGGKNLDQLLHHVSSDALVLWGWAPGGKRTLPPLPHDRFVTAFTTWVASGGACP